MIKPGTMISDRYEIIDLVGSGGMADVYKAKCHRLNRYVAIKVLKSEFSSDKSFVQKFRAEAQSVAGLSHPNIVSVYDVGDDNGLHYIVMELVEGITLKRYIERKKQLDIKEAVGIAIQICQGMDAAHTHHIIHRDIKPQNIIISREGKVKVADFGIAKAATTNTISQNAIGSVHYLSPEQARGGYSDERSDIYSLGVTLYEMLSGQVPFAGDNSVSVALLHIQSEATPVQVLNPQVPASVDRIVQKCMQKKSERRYQTANELIRDLKRSLTNPDGAYITLGSSGAVADSPTRSISDDELTTIKTVSHSPGEDKQLGTPDAPPARKHPKKPAKPARRDDRASRQFDDDELDAVDSSVDRFITVICAVLAVAVIAVVIYGVWIFFIRDNTGIGKGQGTDNVTQAAEDDTAHLILTQAPATSTPTPTPIGTIEGKVEMQRVIGLTKDDATSLLKAVSPEFDIVWYDDYSDEYKAGIVFWQYPAANTLAERNARVELYVSVGVEYRELADVSGKTFDATERMLSTYGYIVLEEHEFCEDVKEGIVIRTDPSAGTPIAKGTEITVYVSDGAEDRLYEMPNLIGMTNKQAKTAIEEAHLMIGTCGTAYSDMYIRDRVCWQSIPSGTWLEPGTLVDYDLSLGVNPEGDQ